MNEEKRAKRILDVSRVKQMYEAGYKVTEIASTLSLPEATVRLYIHMIKATNTIKKTKK